MWMRQKRFFSLFGIIALILCATLYLTYSVILNYNENAKIVNHTREILAEANATLSLLKDAETGQRGFLLTQDEKFLQPYNSANGEIQKHITNLRLLTADNSAQQERITQLENLSRDKLNELKVTIDLQREGRRSDALQIVGDGFGNQAMNSIREVINEIQTEENNLLKVRQVAQQSSNNQILIVISLLILFNLGFFWAIYYFFKRDIARRQQTERQMQALNSSLEERVKERTAQLTVEVVEREKAQEDLRRLASENARLYQEAQKALNNQRELDYLKDLFMSVASHELRNPLASIKGYAEILERGLTKEPTAENSAKWLKYSQNIRHQSNRMNFLIEQLLDFSRIQSDKLELNLTNERDLVEYLGNVVEAQRIKNPSREISLQASGLPISTTFDDIRLEQVLDNLITNAIKYSPDGAPVALGIEQKGTEEAVIWVKDRGFGINPEHQEHIFDRFYRERTDQNAKVQGLGLGLYISHQIILQHGGQMWVESTPGAGSTFYIALPLMRLAPPAPTPISLLAS